MATRSRSRHAPRLGRRRDGRAAHRRRLELGGGLVVDTLDTGSAPAARSGLEPAVLLVHGIGMTSASLEPVAAALAVTHRAVCVTLPGHGSTPSPAHGLSIEEFADAVGEAADRLGLARVVVVGQSMGTQVCVALARSRPDLVSGLVLIGPVVDDRHPRAIDQAIALALDSSRERLATNAVVLRDYVLCGPRWYAKTLPAMLEYPTIVRAADVDVPTIVVRGSGDPIAGPRWVERLAAAMPDARVATLPGPHHVQLIVPDDVAALVRSLANDRSATIRQGPARSDESRHDSNTTTLERRSNA